MATPSQNRRSILKTIGGLAAGGTALTALAGSSGAQTNRAQGGGGQPDTPDENGVYDATVDRIVDGLHIVLLIEEGGQVIDQHVLDHEEYPNLEERDQIRVLIRHGNISQILGER